jgi:hypothetical protein
MRRKRVAIKAESPSGGKGYFINSVTFPLTSQNHPLWTFPTMFIGSSDCGIVIPELQWHNAPDQPCHPALRSLLTALPALKDHHFRRTILFLTHHSAEEGDHSQSNYRKRPAGY